MAAGVSVAAAAVVIAMLVLPTLVDSRHDTTSSTTGTPPSVARLRVALSSGNPLAVARADADLLREAKTIAGPEQDGAVAAHVEAIQFLRAHPSAAAAAALPRPATVPPARDPAPPSTTIAPGRDPVPGPETLPPGVSPLVPVPTTLADGPPSVAIVDVVARLDGTFHVDFTVSGFAPDASGAPGTRSLRFSFDDGQSPTTWDGPSPWSFPLGAGVTYRRVCVHVADSAGVEDLSTGGCHNIV